MDDEIYDQDGRYLGEIKGERLIKNLSKTMKSSSGFSPRMDRVGIVPSVDYVGYVLPVGYDDFPSPEEFKG